MADKPIYDCVTINIFDEVEVHPDCTVQILRNSVTGQESVGWWENDHPPVGLEGDQDE